MSEPREVIRWRSIAKELAAAARALTRGTHWISRGDVSRAVKALERFERAASPPGGREPKGAGE